MKNGKRPTRKEKIVMNKYHLNPNNWLISKRHNGMLILVHRYTNSVRQIPKD
ncbi:DUF6906 family protein [Fervidibacillus albus]|uniref:DUF6906 family protein n=1 Tax=Fervidibacillus albus TaxID=2980026 RepID=UPI003B84AE94